MSSICELLAPSSPINATCYQPNCVVDYTVTTQCTKIIETLALVPMLFMDNL